MCACVDHVCFDRIFRVTSETRGWTYGKFEQYGYVNTHFKGIQFLNHRFCVIVDSNSVYSSLSAEIFLLHDKRMTRYSEVDSKSHWSIPEKLTFVKWRRASDHCYYMAGDRSNRDYYSNTAYRPWIESHHNFFRLRLVALQNIVAKSYRHSC